MDITAFQRLAAANLWGAIWPELSLGCLALALLVVDLLLPRAGRRAVPALAVMGQAAVLAGVLLDFHTRYLGQETFGGLLRHSPAGQAMRIFFLLSSIAVCLMARGNLDRQAMPRVEFYHIVVVMTAAMMLLAQSSHFVMLFVALETVTVGFYVLVSYCRGNGRTLEAGLKYLILGGLSSAILLFGIVLLYGAAGNPLAPGHTSAGLHYGDLARFLAANPHEWLAGLGIVLVLAGVAFKIGAFPFQIWIPDVYQGAPTPVTAFLAVASKAAGFAMLLGLVRFAFFPYAWLVTPVLSFMAGGTILFGNLAALGQHNVKRLIGLSGVSHAGFILMGVVVVGRSPLALGAVYFYLLAYLLASFAVFGVMAHLAGADDTDQELGHYAGLARERPLLAAVLAVGLGSLAGIPPLAGFIGKFLIFVAAFQAREYALLSVAIAGVVMSIFYYFGWIRAAFFDPSAPPAAAGTPGTAQRFAPVGAFAGVALTLLALATVALGFFQGPLGRWLSW